jgi:hypothetical protein
MARRYARDNRGRFASGGGGATARGGRLRTAAGNKRKTQTMQASAAPKGTIGKPRGLKPQSAKKLRTGIAVNRMRSINQKIGKGPDLAQINIKGRFTGQAGKRMDASIDRAVKQTKAAQTAALMKPKAQVRAERAARAEANRAAQAAKPKRTRSVESLRASRAKQIEKRRSITTNPAGERASAAANMAANAARTQQRATAFYKAGGKPARAAAKPAAATTPKQSSRRRRPTAEQSRAAGLMPISDIRARQAAQGAARDASRTRRVQSNMSRARGQQVASTQGKQRAPFGRYSTIKTPAPEGSFPQMAPGRSGLGIAQAAKGRNQPTAPKRRTKTDQQVLQQADRIMGKLAKRMKAAVDGSGDLNAKMSQIQRNNRRGGRVNSALSRRGLLDKYQKLTAGADPIYGARAGKGIKSRSRK